MESKSIKEYLKTLGWLYDNVIADLVAIAKENGGTIELPGNYVCEEYNDQESSYYEAITDEGTVIISTPDEHEEIKITELGIDILIKFLGTINNSQKEREK